MDIFTSVRSELVKLRHTPHLAVHIFVPLIGTVLFAFYFIIYDAVISLTKSEYLICEYLARNKGQVFSREQIYEAVFGFDGESDNSTVATHIKNIRAKLCDYNVQPITTVWGIGYKWE